MDEDSVQFQAPELKVPLPKFPMEKEGLAGQPWPEHLNRQDPFARYRKGASRYYPPDKFDPFKGWRDPSHEPLGEAPAPFAPLRVTEAPLESPSERCQRCGSVFPFEANFCPRCGLARSTSGQSYQHPEKLLPGPPLRHENGNGLPLNPRTPDVAKPEQVGPQVPPPPPQTITNQMMSWFGGASAPKGVAPGPPSIVTPGGLNAEPKPGPPKGTIKSSCRSAKNQRHCPPSTLGPLGPVCR